MKSPNKLYSVVIDYYPKIVCANKKTQINFLSFHGKNIPSDVEYLVSHSTVEGYQKNIEHTKTNRYREEKRCKSADNTLNVEFFFAAEQEHLIRIYKIIQTTGPDFKREKVFEARFFSVNPDLFGRTPYKGDIHMHSCHSDGKESPAHIVALSRELGYDFMALTDHRKYAPSLEAIEKYNGVEIGMEIFPGEEVHSPDNSVHIVHAGGKYSVSESFESDSGKEEFLDDVKKKIESLKDKDIPEEVNIHMYASSLVVFDKIREAGGLSMFCHPFWISWDGYNHSMAVTEALVRDRAFDAYELIGGFDRFMVDSNTLQVAYYHELRAQGIKMPVLGVSDAHTMTRNRLFGWYYSIIFSKSNKFEDIKGSIVNFYSTAVEKAEGESARIYGEYRFVKYGLFLLKEFFPVHDRLCKAQSEMLKAHMIDNSTPSQLDEIKAIKDAVQEYYKLMFGRE